MGVLKTLLILLILLPLPVRADQDRMIADFVACAGRYSAELEHAWLVDGAAAEGIARRRAHFIDLIAAALPADSHRQALHLRILAKAAHGALLREALFSQDPARAGWALRRAESEIAHCSGYLLES